VASTVAWLESSADERRRAREVVTLFTQRDSRDGLGIGLGLIRDALGDTMFPRSASDRPALATSGSCRGSSKRCLRHPGGDPRGLVGRQAGGRVMNLRSTSTCAACSV
jgi:hypothetical protein